jgi:AcrR family transcriptional regulator
MPGSGGATVVANVSAGDTGFPTPPWRKPRKVASGKQPLNQDLIVEVALRILDREGLDGLSMRRIADELDTGAASLYAHVSNKDELLEIMADQVASEVKLPEPDPRHWQEQLKDVCRQVGRALAAHADVARVYLANVPSGPNALRISERIFAIMLAGNVPPRVAAIALDRLFLYVTADAYEGSLYSVRQRASGKSPEQWATDYFGQLAGYYASLPPQQFPNTIKYLDELMAGDGDERFEFGLDLLVRGIADSRPANG